MVIPFSVHHYVLQNYIIFLKLPNKNGIIIFQKVHFNENDKFMGSTRKWVGKVNWSCGI